jgi:cytochrome b561
VFGIVLSGLGIALGFVTPMLDGLFMDAMLGLHDVTLFALPVFLGVHIIGALWHKLARKDGVLESMTGRLPI